MRTCIAWSSVQQVFCFGLSRNGHVLELYDIQKWKSVHSSSPTNEFPKLILCDFIVQIYIQAIYISCGAEGSLTVSTSWLT